MCCLGRWHVANTDRSKKDSYTWSSSELFTQGCAITVLCKHKRLEKIHPFLFCVYNRLRGGRSSSLTSWDFSISCFDHFKMYCCNSKRFCSSSAISESRFASPIFNGLSIVKSLWFFVTFRCTEQTQHDRGQNRAKIAPVGKISGLRLCLVEWFSFSILSPFQFPYATFFSSEFPKFLLPWYFVTSYDFQSVNNVFALLPLGYSVTCMSYSLKIMF